MYRLAKRSIPYITILITLLLIASPQVSFAQKDGDKIYLGEIKKLHSDVLNEDRFALIYTPVGYENGDQSYPVLYLLDGPRHFHHATGILQFMNQQGIIPPMILVGISNTDRTRDMSPTPATGENASNYPNSGGAPEFLQFIREELMPFVETNYRTKPYKILVGHSFGGLFTMFTFLSEPQAFDAYIAISGTYWWDNNLLSRMAGNFLPEHPKNNKFLFFSMGDEGDRMVNSVNGFVDVLKKNALPSLRWKYNFMKKETHGTIVHRSIYDGLEELYDGWRYPNDLNIATLEDVEKHYSELSDRFGYEIKVPEVVINVMGYAALQNSNLEKAITIFKKNVEMYPKSANVYDSLGEGYEADGQLTLAAQNYKKAYERGLEINDPNLTIFKAHLERVEAYLGDIEY
jgi:predicted alpha/beta superfamily hydrolase